ncbi:MAG: hypothetical protein M5R38_14315 [Candidatus Methylomirabilis sp.]|nr:hypothetical protein [Candidatus Methylomirabilis sp.]
MLPGLVQGDDTPADVEHLGVKLLNAGGEIRFIRRERQPPPAKPFRDVRFQSKELRLRLRVDSGQKSPDLTALAEQDCFEFGIGPGSGHAFAERAEGCSFLPVVPDGLRADQEHREHHERETEQQLALKLHE